ncbi:hypothetical protein [Ramlibacter albus]|uniref:Uncharacterized protein n=1 Tax=Ramlibacter albus TaxID=2079448 RepID=A0A923MA00_9BURK|nr:hypothetical protein [Ramlibacter albus]MBC5765626.1 hypothetical protein [Ramlibacter albus]
MAHPSLQYLRDYESLYGVWARANEAADAAEKALEGNGSAEAEAQAQQLRRAADDAFEALAIFIRSNPL